MKDLKNKNIIAMNRPKLTCYVPLWRIPRPKSEKIMSDTFKDKVSVRKLNLMDGLSIREILTRAGILNLSSKNTACNKQKNAKNEAVKKL